MILNKTSIKIISGGQSGVDRAALDYALFHGIPCGGYCPTGRMAEDGKIHQRYPLTETATPDPKERTRLNIEESDGTMIIILKNMDRGTSYTKEWADKLAKPLFIASRDIGFDPEQIRNWIIENNIRVLNVAGPRESNEEGGYGFAVKVLNDIFYEDII